MSLRPLFSFAPLGSVLAAVILGIAGAFLYWGAIDRAAPISDVVGRPVRVDRLRDGSRVLWVEWSFVRRRFCPGETERWLLDGIAQPLPTTKVAPADGQRAGETVTVRVPVPVPASFDNAGTYRISTRYQCNRLQAQFPALLSIPGNPPGVPFDLSEPDGVPRRNGAPK